MRLMVLLEICYDLLFLKAGVIMSDKAEEKEEINVKEGNSFNMTSKNLLENQSELKIAFNDLNLIEKNGKFSIPNKQLSKSQIQERYKPLIYAAVLYW